MTATDDWPPSCAIETLHARAATLTATRAFFAERGVLEVNTPVLASHTVLDPAIESIAVGGRYLQTSPEYHMKRLLAAGAPSIYQLGPVFRQGEQGRWHNPEFLMLEWYRLDFDAERLMREVEELVDCLLGPAPYLRVPYRQLLADRFAIDIDTASPGDLADICAQLGYRASTPPPAEEALDLMLAAALNDRGKGRVFVTEYPPSQAALARLSASGGRPHAERFELVIDGVEIANGYHELADPDEPGPAHGRRRRETSCFWPFYPQAGRTPAGRPTPRPPGLRRRGPRLRPAARTQTRNRRHIPRYRLRLEPRLTANSSALRRGRLK